MKGNYCHYLPNENGVKTQVACVLSLTCSSESITCALNFFNSSVSVLLQVDLITTTTQNAFS